MKLWIDDIRPAPEGYKWCKTVNEAIGEVIVYYVDIKSKERQARCAPILDMDHDAGDFRKYGGDYIEILKLIEGYNSIGITDIRPKIHIHSMNPVGVENMRAIIKRNKWKEF